MRFRCSKKELSDAVGIVGRAVSARSALPALEGVLIKAGEGALNLLAYDLELGISTIVPAEVGTAGEILLNAKIFTDIVRRLPGETVEVISNEKLLTTVKSGAAEFTLPGMPASEFPELPTLSDGRSLSLPQNLLASMIRQTLFAVSTDDSKPVHTGSLFELSGANLTVVSVDGYRLAIRMEKVAQSEEMKFVVPGKTLSEVLKMLDYESDENISISLGRKHILFEVKGYSIISRLLEGEFLDYRNTLGKQSTSTVKVKVREFLDSVDRASLLISDRLKSPVRCVFEDDVIKVSCSTTVGRVYDEVEASLSGEKIEMGFNNRYLLDALRATESDEVRIILNGPLSPMKICPPEGENFIFLVLPVRLKSDA